MQSFPDGTFLLRTSDCSFPGKTCLFPCLFLVGLAAFISLTGPADHPESPRSVAEWMLAGTGLLYALGCLLDSSGNYREQWTIGPTELRFQKFARSGAPVEDWRAPKEKLMIELEELSVGGDYGLEGYSTLSVTGPPGKTVVSVTGSRGSSGYLTEADQKMLFHYLASMWACPITETVVGEPDRSEGKRTLTVSPEAGLNG